MAVLPSHHDLLQRLQDYRTFDEARQSEVDFLAQTCLKLHTERLTLQSDLDDERNTRRTWKKRAEEAEAATQRKFAVVLVDGDGYIFQKAFFNALAISGGSKAANELYNEVINYLRASDAGLSGAGSDCDVLVNIYANKAGLARALATVDYLNHPAQIDQFFCSFSQSRSLFQFIDCGHGKERVDAKLRDTFRFYAYNAQCHRVFLACSHDNGYIAEFDKYRHDPVVLPKLVLVNHAAQTAATARAYSGLPFKSTIFETVFEPQPLDLSVAKVDVAFIPHMLDGLSLGSSPVTEHAASDLTFSVSRSSHSSTSAPPVSSPLAPLPVNTKSSSVSQAKVSTPPTEVAKPKPSNPAPSGATTTTTNGTCDAKNGIPVNRHGQRVDLKMRVPTAAETAKFEDRIAYHKLCNEHHLRDNCESYNCKYDHDAIDASMRNTLRYKARSIACAQGFKCRRLDCFYGHQCPWGNDNCGNIKCAFIKAGLHDIRDLEVSKFVPAQPGYFD